MKFDVSSDDVLAIVGAQYGSEGKGVVVSHLANNYDVHVRVGGPNAGHSISYGGRVYKMQSLPCGWINGIASLVLGRGALVDIAQLDKEIQLILETENIDIRPRLFIDRNAMVLDDRHHAVEGGVRGELHKRIGSTGHGVGAARHARMARNPTEIMNVEKYLAQNAQFKIPNRCVHPDTAEMLNRCTRQGYPILLEGTQGSGLSLLHGPWPYVTSADTNAAQMAVDVGLPPRAVNRTMLVVRSHPIRVAGNSGPLKNETTWEAISKELGRDVIEQTTVTKKVRRVGQWDEELFTKAVMLNKPTSLAFTFADYHHPSNLGVTEWAGIHWSTKQFINYLEKLADAPVLFIGTGWHPGEQNWVGVQIGGRP